MTTAAETAPTRRSLRIRARRSRRLLAAAVTCLILGLVPLTGVLIVQGVNSSHAAAQAERQERAMERWTPAEQRHALAQAHAYNQTLYKSSQHAIGAVMDGRTSEPDFAAKTDKTYWNTLKGPQGVMGTVRIPSIGVTLPIRHGSDEAALANGAGHLYGTSLPVGGKDTHTVITAHRGVPDKELFTRLDELKKGDVFYLNAAGGTLAYRVTRVQETDPSDTSLVRIEQGKDLATLLTCTPYGVNTRRLLVTGKRVSMPDDAPNVEDAPKDRKPLLVGAGTSLTVMFIGCSLIPPEKHVQGLHMKGFAH